VGAVSLDFLPQFQVRVKLRRTQYEHMFSALPSNSDIARRSRHVSKVPKAVTRASIKTKVADVCSDSSEMKLTADRFVNALL
jgi:hypothetical protein